MWVFGCARIIGSNGKSFPLTVKYALWPCKTISVCILPSNQFRPKKTEEREKQQGREIAHQHRRAHATWSTTEIAHQHRLVAPQHRWDRTPPWALIHIQATQRNITQSPFRQTHTHLAQSTPTRSRAAWSTTKIAPQHRRDRTYDPPMLDLSLSRSTSPFPSLIDHSLFLLLSVW